MSKPTTCVDCRFRHDYHKRPLTKKEAWCTHLSKFVSNKKNCIHREPA